MTVQIYPEVQVTNLRRLASAVCLRALEEAKQKRNPQKQLEAVAWLMSDDAPVWLDWAQLQSENPIALLTTGKLKRIRIRVKGKVKHVEE